MSWGQRTREQEQRQAEKDKREQEIRKQPAQQKQEQKPKAQTDRQRQINERNERAAQSRIETTRIREDAKTQRMQMRMQNSAARRAARANRGGAPTVAGAIMGSIVASVLLFAVIVSVGPLVDYFQVWLTQQNGNPYAAPVLDLFTWIYILAFASWVTYIIVVWRAVTANISYGVFD